jgi:hypothetical protein
MSVPFWITIVAVLYLLLLGPFVVLHANGTISQEAWEAIGYPAMLLGYHIGDSQKTLSNLYGEYMNWWGTLAGIPR